MRARNNSTLFFLSCTAGVFLLLNTSSTADPEAFRLKSTKTEKVFGPFDYSHGATVTIGKVTFEILRNAKPEQPPTVEETPQTNSPPKMVPGTDAETAAIEAAIAWLATIDKDEFSKGWDEAALFLQETVQRDEFVRSQGAMREALGPMNKRTFNSVEYSNTMPSAPEGKYYIIRFTTKLKNKPHAEETIVTKLQNDGKWRVCGHHIR
jgi:hypothetical protein